jgi:hypothetical protein
MSASFYGDIDRAIRLLREACGESEAIGYSSVDEDNRIAFKVQDKLREAVTYVTAASQSLQKFIK